MKTTKLIIATFAAMALFSCSKTGVVEKPQEHPEYVKLSFEVEAEQSRTSVNDLGQVSWSEPDSVLVLWEGGSAKGTISGNVLSVEAAAADAYYAVYPYDATATLEADNLTVTIPNEVDGSFSQANYMAAKAVGNKFAFKHVCGVLKIEMPTGYAEVRVRANDSASATCGTETVTFDAEGNVTVETAAAEENYSFATAAELPEATYIPILANASWPVGFVVYTKQTTNSVAGALSTGSVTWSRAKLVNAGNVVSRIHDWYIKETACGKGDGSDWDNAGDASLLVKLLSKNIWAGGSVVGTFDGVPNAWRLHNRKIYIAEGTYDLVDNGGVLTMNYANDINLEIKGGFDASATGTDLTSYDPETNITNFTANHDSGTSNARIFNGQGQFRYFRFHGIHFDNLPATCSSARGAVIYFNNSAKTATSSSYRGVVFTDCYFQNNTVSGMGLVDANFKTSANCGKIEFNNCVFKNNTMTYSSSSSFCSGAFVSESSSTAARFNNCLFENNYASGANGRGAAIAMANGSVYIDHCTFNGNRASYAADVYLGDSKSNSAWLYNTVSGFINASSFNNYSITSTTNSNYFAFSVMGYQKNTTLCMNNCSFGGHVIKTYTGTEYTASGTDAGCHILSNGNLCIVNTSVVGIGTQLVRPNISASKDNSAYLINNALIHTTDGNPVNQSTSLTQNGYYNLLKAGKNSYATIAKTDDDYVKYANFTSMTWVTNHWEWVLSTAYASRPKAAEVEELVVAAYPAFDTWLKSLNSNPYGIDIRGEARNSAKLNPGSWDPGL